MKFYAPLIQTISLNFLIIPLSLTVMEEMSKDDEGVGFRNKDDLNQATRFLHENGKPCYDIVTNDNEYNKFD